MGVHDTHRTRISFDASSYDEICNLCGAHDEVLGGFGRLEYPCPASEEKRKEYDVQRAEQMKLYESTKVPKGPSKP